MTIRVYASKFNDSPHETHSFGGPTVADWIKANAPSYDPSRATQDFSVAVNGLPLCASLWASHGVSDADLVDITIEPKGTELFFGGLFFAAVSMMTPKVPKLNMSGTTKSGKELDTVMVKGNKVKINDVRPEIAGYQKIYPSFLKPKHGYFAGLRSQKADLCLNIGEGDFDVLPSDIFIGDTPVVSLGDDITWKIYKPGQSLAADSRAVWWHDVTEVGSGSNGSSGLDMTVSSEMTPTYTAPIATFSNYSVTIPASEGSFPADWTAGMIVRIETQYQYTVIDGGAGRDVIKGDALSMLNPSPGDAIQVTGPNAGYYTVNSYTPYSPAVAPVAGTASTVTASNVPARYDYNVSPVTFKLGGGPIRNRLDDIYSWLGAATPTIWKSNGIAVTSVPLPASASGNAYKIDVSTATTTNSILLHPTNTTGNYALTLEPGTYQVSFYASSANDGTTIQAGVWDGSAKSGAVQSITSVRTRYVFTVVIPSTTFGAVQIFPNRAGLASNTITIDSPQIEKDVVTPFARGTRVVTINTATANLTGLVDAINAKIDGSGITASATGGRVKLTEYAEPKSGNAITLTGSTTDIFGGSPVFVTGTAPVAGSPAVEAQMTLDHEGGQPAVSLELGTSYAAIGPRGFRYRLSAAGTQAITVGRLTSSGGVDDDFPGFQTLTQTNSIFSLDPSSLEGGWRGPFVGCPENELTQTIQYDVMCPKGLIWLGMKGERFTMVSRHTLEWRDMALAGDWTSVTQSFEATTLNAVGKSFTVDLPYPMRPEIRIKKVFVDMGGQINEYVDDIVWYGARTKLAGKTVYPTSTVIVLTVRGGDRLSADAESQVWVKATRKLPVRESGAWQPARATRDIVPFCLYVLKSIGYTDADFDLPAWDAFDATCRARGDTYDFTHSTGTTVHQAIEDALAAGFAELTVVDGLLTPKRDEPMFYKSLYTSDSMIEPLDIRFSSKKIDDYDGVNVEYLDGKKWQKDTVKCRLPGDLGNRILTMTVNGVTDRKRAWRLGMRKRRDLKYRKKIYAWSTEAESFNSNYLDLAQVSGQTPGYATSSYMTGYSNRLITSDTAFPWDEFEGPHYVSVRNREGKNFGPTVVTRVNDFQALMVTPLGFVPDFEDHSSDKYHMLFGLGYAVQITDIKFIGADEAEMEGRQYDVRVYLDDDSELPPE